MRVALTLLLVVHGALHLLGPARAFGLAELPQLTQPISRTMGVAWLVAAALLLVTAALVIVAPRVWWIVGAIALVASQLVIMSSWADARWGTVANVLLLLAVVVGVLTYGPWSLWAQYRRDVERLVPQAPATELLTSESIAGLPAPVRRYLERVGAIGQPRVASYRARWKGRIRSGPDAPWMALSAEQHNVVEPAARLFSMDASMLGVPIDGLHRYVESGATMHVKALGAVTVAREGGDELTHAETVTLLNDMCVLAPSTLAGPNLVWEPGTDRDRARVAFTNAGHTVRAELVFDDDGDLVDFVSDDRARSEGGALTRKRWSTPLGGYRRFGELRVAARGSALWHEAEGPYPYIELELVEHHVSPTIAERA
ncbi:MAG: hypothetical protein J0L92_12400 [Deltaproteobacteria bacterium]|nr:hypothetical protein [Deltaproteobacteria bacterium]